jgi:hypothetical protein
MAVPDVGIQVVTYRGQKPMIAQRTEKMADVEAMWDEANYSSKQLCSVEDVIHLGQR